jgi:mono/diheme cytochrome c family protein
VLLALTTNQELGLGGTAAVFIAFALFAALVIPRRRPDFPGRRGLVPFILVTVILTIAMLGAVEVFAKEEHHPEAAGEETTPGETPTETTPTETTPAPPPPTTTGGEQSGSAQAGKAVFASAGCAGCHTFAAAGATGTVGPNLEEGLAGKTRAYIEQSIVDPNAVITPGYSAGVMPQTYKDQLSPKQLNDLLAFLTAR